MASASIEQLLFLASLLLLAGVLVSKASHRLGVPALLLFLLVGMLAGSDGPGGIWFDNAYIAQFVGVTALAYILFGGGMDTEWKACRPVFWQSTSLATLGVFLTTIATGTFARWVLDTGWLESLLLGAIVSSTDAAAVFGILRSHQQSLKGRLRPLLEFESGSNDPMAVFLTVSLIQLVKDPSLPPYTLLVSFVTQMGIGTLAGLGFGAAGAWAVNRIRLETEGLYPVLTFAMVPFIYSATALMQGSGFLAVYVAGIIIGNSDLIHRRSLLRFHDGLAWLMQIAMFLVLGLLVFPSRLWPIAGAGMALALFLMFVARPFGVFVSLLLARMNLRQKVLVSWVGLRGAAPIMLATFPLLSGVPQADMYFNLVFFIVLTSVLLQATTLAPVSRWLGLEAPLPVRKRYPLEFVPAPRSRSDMVEFTIPQSSPLRGKRVVDLNLPKSALIVLIGRGEDFLAPRGATVLLAGDTLLVLTDKADVETARKAVEG